MKEIEKQEYDALDTFLSFNKKYIWDKEKEGIKLIKSEVEKRLLDLGYIDYKEDSKELYAFDMFITKKGYEHFCFLREIRRKDYSWLKDLITIIIGITSIIALLKAFGVI